MKVLLVEKMIYKYYLISLFHYYEVFVNTLFGSNTQLQATLTVVGRDSGARITIPIIVTKTSA